MLRVVESWPPMDVVTQGALEADLAAAAATVCEYD